ncbi:MAG: radical SAM protein [Spirochaetes bacterium]|nr:radical SAM protein [Spirochaetota bacterium]
MRTATHLPIDILGLTSGELIEAARRLLPSGAGVAGKLHARAHATGRLEPEAFGLSAASCRAWRDAFTVGLLGVRRTVEEPGEHGATVKAVMVTGDGSDIECVRVPVPVPAGRAPRATLCVSSQVGCRMGCVFCETGCMGLVRSLSAAEIVSQVVTARTTLGWDCRNVVFMGMGEPLDNLEELAQALWVLTDMRGLRFPAERLTVCTVGDAEGIRGLRELGMRRLNLSVSLNAAEDALRSRLMPVNRRTDLAALAAVLAAYPQRRTFVLGVNYCLLPGINDSRGDAHRVAVYCASLGRVYVNLIPYNPGTRPLCRAPAPDETERFLGWLREEGLEAGLRSARGGSIMAGCGQLGEPRGG